MTKTHGKIRGKVIDSATFKTADGTGKVKVTDKGTLYVLLFEKDTARNSRPTMGVETPSSLVIAPAGVDPNDRKRGKLIDSALVVTADDKAVIVRSYTSGKVTVRAEGSWAQTWETYLKPTGCWHYAMLRVA